MLRKISSVIVILSLSIVISQAGDIAIQKGRLVPKLLNYQGYLTDTIAIPIDDTLDMTFKIFDAVSSGNELWSEMQTNVPIERGVFSVMLGQITPIPDSVFADFTSTWLELTLEGPLTLIPRTRITSVGYAYTSTYSDTAEYARVGADNDWIRGTPDSVLFTANYLGIARGGADNLLRGSAVFSHINLGVACTTGVDGENRSSIAIGGGYSNNAIGSISTISGGRDNTASGSYATVSGGQSNTASGPRATVIGGRSNIASGDHSTTGGGFNNTSSGIYATSVGGYENFIEGDYSAICGGYADTIFATADYSYLFGIASKLTEDSTFMVDMPHIRFGDEINGYEFPKADGSVDQVMVTDGSGQMSWNDIPTVDVDTTWVRGTPDSVLFTTNYLGIARGGADNVLYGSNVHTHTNFGMACTTGLTGQNYTYITVSGGYNNTAGHRYATVGGGRGNKARGESATVSGGLNNRASGSYATVCGGYNNSASNAYATVAGGMGITVSGLHGFAANSNSNVTHTSSSAFNGQATTATGQTRVGTLSKASGTFTIDHPLDPMNKILNHYFVESPEMVLIYRGVVNIGTDGRAEVQLADYFEALNQNPMVQLTGIGTSDVFVTEEVENNQFIIGGKPGTKVYWMVTGERKDPSAEVTKIIMPVEQSKEGELAGRSLDDDFLAVTKTQLEEMGKADGFTFRTEAGRRKYENMKRMISE
ncbi:MAG: hypothetical protein WBB37_12395 [bacterium]